MSNLYAPFRYDYVGSFLRPAGLKQARAGYEAGTVTAGELKAVEDKCIAELTAKQKAAGYPVITDGEYRRSAWHLDFMWGMDGVGHRKTKTGLPFHGEAAMIDDTFVTGRIGLTGEHPFVEHFRFVKALEDERTVAKQTIPAPAQTLAQFWMPFSRKITEAVYPNVERLMEDIAQVYITVLGQLFDAGCRNVQLDDCTWGMLADKKGQEMYAAAGEDVLAVQNAYKDINNQVISGSPEGMNITTHVCRGNYHSSYANSGPYDAVADVLFREEKVSAYYLEFDDERSGGFEPLAKVSEGKKVVLGLVTTKRPDLESKESVIARIHEAAQYIPLDSLYLSPQCGFASCEIGNKLTEEDQWAKLALVREIAEEVWG